MTAILDRLYDAVALPEVHHDGHRDDMLDFVSYCVDDDHANGREAQTYLAGRGIPPSVVLSLSIGRYPGKPGQKRRECIQDASILRVASSIKGALPGSTVVPIWYGGKILDVTVRGRQGGWRNREGSGRVPLTSTDVGHTVVTVEGPIDALSLRAMGCPSFMALRGNAIDRHSVEVFKGREAVIWPDFDDPGMQGALQNGSRLSDLGVRCRVILPEMIHEALPWLESVEGLDPNDLWRRWLDHEHVQGIEAGPDHPASHEFMGMLCTLIEAAPFWSDVRHQPTGDKRVTNSIERLEQFNALRGGAGVLTLMDVICEKSAHGDSAWSIFRRLMNIVEPSGRCVPPSGGMVEHLRSQTKIRKADVRPILDDLAGLGLLRVQVKGTGRTSHLVVEIPWLCEGDDAVERQARRLANL